MRKYTGPGATLFLQRTQDVVLMRWDVDLPGNVVQPHLARKFGAKEEGAELITTTAPDAMWP